MTPKKAYDDQKRHAEQRGIEFILSYENFLEVWLLSGKWLKRGRGFGEFCMCRFNDTGPYARQNVYIDSVENNLKQRWNNREVIDLTKAREISELYFSGKYKQHEIAELFGVTQSYVSRIVNKKRKQAYG